MLTKSIVSVCLGLLAANASAQACATLTVTGTGAPGTSLTFDLDGTDAGAFAILAVGQTQGTTTIPLGPLGSLTLGLATPFIPLPLGFTNATGDLSRTISIPTGVTWGIDLFGQGVTADYTFSPGPPPTFSISFCASTVASFHVGV
jgi:hypothetical protein